MRDQNLVLCHYLFALCSQVSVCQLFMFVAQFLSFGDRIEGDKNLKTALNKPVIISVELHLEYPRVSASIKAPLSSIRTRSLFRHCFAVRAVVDCLAVPAHIITMQQYLWFHYITLSLALALWDVTPQASYSQQICTLNLCSHLLRGECKNRVTYLRTVVRISEV